jgi:hypothetical protein
MGDAGETKPAGAPTIEDMARFLADNVMPRLTTRDGSLAGDALLTITRDEAKMLEAVTRFLALITPFRPQIVDLVYRGGDDRRGRR